MIVVHKLSKYYINAHNGHANKVLDEVSFTISKGEILGLTGPSGAGKTTLLRCILQLSRPTSGSVFFNDKDICLFNKNDLRKYVRPYLRKIYQHSSSSLNPGQKCFDSIMRATTLHSPISNVSDLKDNVLKLCYDCGLDESLLYKFPHQLSGGEKRRISFLRALSTKPKVIFADEPFSGLDKVNQYYMIQTLLRLIKKHNLTLVVISHDTQVIKHICNRIIFVNNGEIEERVL